MRPKPTPPTKEEIEKLRAEHRALGCKWCDDCEKGAMAPRFEGSVSCESGSIASGGHNAHCTCDGCW